MFCLNPQGMTRQETTLYLLTNNYLQFLLVRKEMTNIQNIKNNFIPPGASLCTKSTWRTAPQRKKSTAPVIQGHPPFALIHLGLLKTLESRPALISACMDSGNVLCSNQSKQNLLRCQLIKRNPKPILFSRVFPCLSPVFKTQRKTLKSLPRLFQFYRYTRSYLGTISYANRSVCSDLHSDFEKVCHDFFNLTGNLAHA